MAILITVYECDICKKLAGVQTPAQQILFDAAWWEGFKVQFCPECRGTAQAELLMQSDAQMILDIAKRFEEKENSQNAEFIN